MATADTEIRKLEPAQLCSLAQILNHSDSWKRLMSIIPAEDNDQQIMFNQDHFTMIEQAVQRQKRSGAEIFLDEWSTIGRRRPTCGRLLDLLVKAQLFRAADYLAVEVLKVDAPERPQFGPAAPIDVSDKVLEELLKQQAENLESDSVPLEEVIQAWSLHYVEKPDEPIPVHAGRLAQQPERSDLIKFSTNRSDLMKFSEPISDFMKFSSKVDEPELPANYLLQEARSEEIPLCVMDNPFQKSNSTEQVSSEPQDSGTVTSMGSEDDSQALLQSEQNKMKQNETKQNETAHNESEENERRHDKAEQSKTEKIETEARDTEQQETEQVKAEQNRAKHNLQNVSDNVLPVVVLEYNQIVKGNSKTNS